MGRFKWRHRNAQNRVVTKEAQLVTEETGHKQKG